MPASFDGNDGNDGNSANSGGGGNATSVSSGWFFADRVNLPLVTAPDRKPVTATPNVMIGRLPAIKIKNFPDWNWSAEWYAWRALNEFAGTRVEHDQSGDERAHERPAGRPGYPVRQRLPRPWIGRPPPCCRMHRRRSNTSSGRRWTSGLTPLAEILSQSDEFISYFLNMMTARPGGLSEHDEGARDRQSGGHVRCDVLQGSVRAPAAIAAVSGAASPDRGAGARVVPERPFDAGAPDGAVHGPGARYGLPQQPVMNDDLWTLADRIARNREIAGLHYRSDTLAACCSQTASCHCSAPTPTFA